MDKTRAIHTNGCLFFSAYDEWFINENYLTMSDKEMAAELGRSLGSIKNYRWRRGLGRPRSVAVKVWRRSKAEYEADRKVIKMRRLIAEYETAGRIGKEKIREELKRLSGL